MGRPTSPFIPALAGMRLGRWLGAWGGACLMLWLAAVPVAHAATPPGGLVQLPGSIKRVPATSNTTASPHIARNTLRPEELNAAMDFQLSLKMRNYAELQARLNRGESISPAEMAARYWPLQTDYDAAVQWLQQQGFTVNPSNPSHLLISATGTVAQVQAVFQTTFARVSSEGLEFTSAVTAPSVPAALAPMLVGVNGLQPHLRQHPHLIAHPADATSFNPPFYPNQIKQAYGASSLTQNGTGQTIAIIMSAFPGGNVTTSSNLTNLTKFWTATGITRTGTYVGIAVGVGPTASASSIDAEEACLDTEWSSAIAPGANIRMYGVPSLANADTDSGYQQVYNDAIAHPEFGLHVLSLSFGGSETSASQLETDDQLFAQLATAGITVFASSGDNGSSDGAQSPASDPNVTGVGGTSITINSTGVVTSESGWVDSGGGSSAYFAKPAWQTGTGVAGTISTREVPDIAAPADPDTGALIVYNGSNTTVGGTSWSAPTWAGFAALINQARIQNNGSPLGLLNPQLYPLLGSANFRDITSGSNGDFTAGAGYDMVTGIGVPVFPNLLNQLTLVLSPPETAEVNAGQSAVFSFIASSSATSFQWQRLPANGNTWVNLSDNGTYSGSATKTLVIGATTAAMSGDQFRAIVNGVQTPSAALIVLAQPMYVTTLAGQPGTPGTNDGQGEAAQFNDPNDVALDSGGNIIVADTNNNAVRKITPGGLVTTIAGQKGVADYINANGTAAAFDFDNAVDIDGHGIIYVADSNNNAIRKIATNGNVTTFAGSLPVSFNSGNAGNTGTTNGNGTAARFNFPAGIAVAPNGSIIVADSSNNLIRKITSSGNVTTIAGRGGVAGSNDGNGTSAEFNFPAAVVVDSGGNIFVADSNNNDIRKITTNGTVTTFAGSAGNQGVVDGTGNFARFNYPSGIAIDGSNNLYITDTNNNAIRMITPAGVVSTLAGQMGVEGTADGVGNTAQFNQPYGAVINNATGVIYIADLANHAIRQMQPALAPQITLQPANVTVPPGEAASFTTNATGLPAPSFHWQRLPGTGGNWTNLTDDDTYNGSATANLTINTTTTDMDGDQFQCLVSNALATVTSNTATLSIREAPVFTTQPTSLTINAGDSANFTAIATGWPAITYQWQQLSGGSWSNLTDGGPFSGSGSTTLSINATSTTLSGAQFRALATNGVAPDATSAAATLTVEPTGYQVWAGSLNLSGAKSLPAASPFGDTIPNLARFAMNIGATPAPGDLPTLATQVIGGTAYLTLSYNVSNSLVGEQVVAQYSYDLVTWQTVAPAATVQLANPNSQTSRFQAQVAIPAKGTVFLRLVIEPTQ